MMSQSTHYDVTNKFTTSLLTDTLGRFVAPLPTPLASRFGLPLHLEPLLTRGPADGADVRIIRTPNIPVPRLWELPARGSRVAPAARN